MKLTIDLNEVQGMMLEALAKTGFCGQTPKEVAEIMIMEAIINKVTNDSLEKYEKSSRDVRRILKGKKR